MHANDNGDDDDDNEEVALYQRYRYGVDLKHRSANLDDICFD
jgi:hypothetical protein